jgi:hypothetical protein
MLFFSRFFSTRIPLRRRGFWLDRACERPQSVAAMEVMPAPVYGPRAIWMPSSCLKRPGSAEMRLVEMNLVHVDVPIACHSLFPQARHTSALLPAPSSTPLRCWLISSGDLLLAFLSFTAASRSARAPRSFTSLLFQLYTLLNLP